MAFENQNEIGFAQLGLGRIEACKFYLPANQRSVLTKACEAFNAIMDMHEVEAAVSDLDTEVD